MNLRQRIVLIMHLAICTSALSQSINNITISKDQIAFIKAGDSLFVTTLASNSQAILVDHGLSKNGNQRLLKWSTNNQELVYEKDSNLYIFNIDSARSKLLNTTLRDSLCFFKWWRVKHAAVSQHQLYFAAHLKGDSDYQQLFRINMLNGNLQQITNDSINTGNIAASHNGRYLAYSTYQYSNQKPVSILYITDNNAKPIIISEKAATFYDNFSWSPNDELLLAITGSTSKLYRIDINTRTLKQLHLPLESNEKPVGFFNDRNLIYVKGTQTGLVNLNTGEKMILLNQNETLLEIRGEKALSEVLYIKESASQPKAIWQRKISSSKDGALIKHLASNNPLAKYTCVIQTYKNSQGKTMSAYIYLPGNYSKKPTGHPVILVPYGGYSDKYPALNYFLYEHLFDYLDKGYILIFPNSGGYSSEIQTDEYGKIQLADTELFIKEATQHINIDLKRLWLIGHSHGATMVYYYLTHSNLFKGGVAVNGAADWIKQADLESMSGLPWGMGGKADQFPEKYRVYSPIENIIKLEKPMLLVAGKKDSQIPYLINSLAFHELAAKNNKNTRLILFDDEGHLIEKAHNKKVFSNAIDAFLKLE